MPITLFGRMVRYVTLTYVLAPVDLHKLERAKGSVVLGDQTTDIDEAGVAIRKPDEPGNLMGAIFAQWHDTAEATPQPAEEFVRRFSSRPVEVRKTVIEDPHRNEAGDCGRHFQGDHGDTHTYDGFLLVAPEPDDIEEFFCWADEIFA
jgi:hypothetical protein